MKKLILGALIILGASTTQSAFAQDTYKIDPSHTNILLEVSHGGFSTMTIEALNPDGTIVFDQENPENSSVNLTLKSENIDGDGEKFNEHLHSADFFNVKEYPEITFKSTSVKVTGENKGTILGDLTLVGITKPVTLDVTFNKAGENPFSKKETIGFSASGLINRSDYKIDYALPFVGEEVTLNINVEATK
ncbi:MAG: polyisoprenoid-binding protein [Alphaproteobacteria bacterium]|nr:polyisoprenoid-binding protein [Alphaproteobacteria bacterium]